MAEMLAWQSGQEPEPSVLVKGLLLHPKQDRKLLKGSVHKRDLSYLFLEKDRHVIIHANLSDP